SLVGMSGMSYGSLGKNAVKALSLGLDMAQGTWMNTGEGGLSPYHMEANVDIIMQIGPAIFGVRTPEAILDLDELNRKSEIERLSLALDMAQGRRINRGEGGLSPYHMEGNVDIIMQIGPAMFGVRTPEGKLDLEELKRKSEIEQLKAFELKLGQGAKTRGGH